MIPASMRRLTALFALLALLPTANAGSQQASGPVGLTGYWNGVVDDGSRVASGDIAITQAFVTIEQRGRTVDVQFEAQLSNRGQQRGDAMEARLALPLPDQAVVTGYAIEVDGVLIPGTLLDQPKARRVYETEVRKGIDPGLGEVKGNRFDIRVFPLAAGESRRVRVRFSAPIDAANGFALPWIDAPVSGPVTVRYKGTAIGGRPVLTLPWGANVEAKAVGDDWSGSATAASAQASGTLKIGGTAGAARLIASQHDNGAAFFELTGAPEAAASAASPTPGRLRVYWDRSWSRSDDALDLEIALLDQYLASNRVSGIDLISFAEDKPIVTSLSNAADLRAALLAQRYLGATRLTGLDELNLPAAARCVMFTDGARTLDPAAEFSPGCGLTIVASAPDADSAWLTNLAQDNGGQLLRLTSENRDQLAQQLSRPARGVVRIRTASGQRVSFRSFATTDGGWHVVGPLAGDGPLSVWVANEDGTVKIERFDGAAAPRAKHGSAGALWAAGEVSRLSDDPAQHDAMVKLARDFQVASASMAFLVLESPDQYVDADVAPPAEGFDAEWRASYAELRKAKDEAEQETQAEHLEMVRNNWEQRKSWWEQSFNPNARAKRDVQDQDAAAAGADAAGFVSEPAPSPSPAPPPPPMVAPPTATPPAEPRAEEAADAAAYDSAIVVTSSRTEKRASEDAAPVAESSKVEIADLLSDADYIAALDAAAPAQRETVLWQQAKEYGALAGFWLDVAEWFRVKGDTAMAMRLLLTALDAATADDETRQIVAFRLERDGRIDDAVSILERFAALNAERPQPNRLLALALAKRGRPGDTERAFKLLTDVALTPFDHAFNGIDVIALTEANGLIPALNKAGTPWKLAPEFVALLDTDVRLVIEWTNDDADIDLWVIEPNRERVYYSNNLSSAGGAITDDMTDGYGPEEYDIRRARAGDYQVRIHGYSPDRINPNGTGRVTVRLIRDFGRPTQHEQLVDAEIGFKRDSQSQGDGSRGIATLRFNPRQ